MLLERNLFLPAAQAHNPLQVAICDTPFIFLVNLFVCTLQAVAVSTDKKLRRLGRLNLLLIQVRSAVEVSEKHAIENAWLIKWRDRLKEAAAEGDEACSLASAFRKRQRATDAVQGLGDDAHQQQEQDKPSSSSSPTVSPATTT